MSGGPHEPSPYPRMVDRSRRTRWIYQLGRNCMVAAMSERKTLIDKAEALAILAPAPNAKDGLWAKRKQALYDRVDALPERGVGVKPLAWIEIEDDDCDFEAFASGLRYWIVSVTDHQHTVKCNTYEIGDCLTVEKAKAAAQADYAARILAALAPTDAAHVSETPKSEHDAGNVLTDAAQAREAALREASGVLLGMMQKCQASMSKDGYDKGLQLMCDTLGAADAAILALLSEART